MVRYAEVQENAVVQLGRFNKDRKALSHKVGFVVGKETERVGNGIVHRILVQTSAKETVPVQIHNIRAVLA